MTMAPRQSYGSIAIKQAEELESFVPIIPAADAADKKKKKCVAFSLAIVALAIAGVGYITIASKAPAAAVPNRPSRKSFNHSTNFDDDASLLLSKKSPVDLGFDSIVREADALPSTIWGNISGPLPTNSWYLVRFDEDFFGCVQPLQYPPSHTMLVLLYRIWCLKRRPFSLMIPQGSILSHILLTRRRPRKWLAFACTGL